MTVCIVINENTKTPDFNIWQTSRTLPHLHHPLIPGLIGYPVYPNMCARGRTLYSLDFRSKGNDRLRLLACGELFFFRPPACRQNLLYGFGVVFEGFAYECDVRFGFLTHNAAGF